MDLTISERVAIVETKLDRLQTDLTSTANDVRVIRDYISTTDGVKKFRAKEWAVITALLSAGAAFTEIFHRFVPH